MPTDSCGSTVKGLTGTGSKSLTQDTAGVPGPVEAEDQFGASVELTDSNKDGRAELVADAFAENEGAGSVWPFKSGTSGITATGSTSFGAASRSVGLAPTDRRRGRASRRAWRQVTRLWSAPWRTR
ncbi:hypothetical protein [Streptomyces sp. NP-1717]|uniref:hypothetical protein n=1 Tax=Streptomyces sp. NP-1717 TaxID=2704470 RepID=UPI001F5E1EC7|nr:hypothetical protein [Streptomyces sp. NP-1717]MCI3223799.1 hypothetical protein [Streptomyces sp. NP-1717]